MGNRSAEVDAYIAHAQPFARPILKKLRTLFHRACPGVEERIKWGVITPARTSTHFAAPCRHARLSAVPVSRAVKWGR